MNFERKLDREEQRLCVREEVLEGDGDVVVEGDVVVVVVRLIVVVVVVALTGPLHVRITPKNRKKL